MALDCALSSVNTTFIFGLQVYQLPLCPHCVWKIHRRCMTQFLTLGGICWNKLPGCCQENTLFTINNYLSKHNGVKDIVISAGNSQFIVYAFIKTSVFGLQLISFTTLRTWKWKGDETGVFYLLRITSPAFPVILFDVEKLKMFKDCGDRRRNASHETKRLCIYLDERYSRKQEHGCSWSSMLKETDSILKETFDMQISTLLASQWKSALSKKCIINPMVKKKKHQKTSKNSSCFLTPLTMLFPARKLPLS